MPMYMDIHDVPGVKAEDVARAHLRDVAVQGRHGVEYIIVVGLAGNILGSDSITNDLHICYRRTSNNWMRWSPP